MPPVRDWDTLVKILEHTEPPGYRQAQPRAKRKIGPFLEVIDEILEGDKTVHRRQHHTARRIFDRLKDEYGYPGGYTAVKEVVRERRLRQVHIDHGALEGPVVEEGLNRTEALARFEQMRGVRMTKRMTSGRLVDPALV